MRGLKLYIIGTAVLLTLYLVARYNQPKSVNWKRTYSVEDKIPYGTYVLRQRLADLFPKAKIDVYREPVYNVLTERGLSKGAYIIIAPDINIGEYDYGKLRKFLADGNDVFISTSRFGRRLYDSLHVATNYFQGEGGDGYRLVAGNQDSTHTYRMDKASEHNTFNKLDTAHARILGFNDANDVNFVRYNVGKGKLYLHSAPDVFTNISLLSDDGATYAAAVLSYLKPTSRVIIDQYFALGREDEETTLRVLLRNPPMRWAFYIAFFGLILFVLYEIKRRQRIIPVVEPVKNDTLNFVNVVGRVYYEQHDNANIAVKKINYFAENVRSRLNLRPDLTDPDFAQNLARKSGAEQNDINELLGFIKYISNQHEVSNAELMRLNTLIDRFYAQTK